MENMSGVPDQSERRSSERNTRPMRDDIYLEVGARGQPMRKTDNNPRNSKWLKNESGPSQEGTAKESDGNVQDQIIIAPEIMKKILNHLNLRALKRVRLVCKSWVLEAQTHMERRGIVVLERNATTSFPRLLNFTDMRENKIQALPQPFKSLDVNISLTSEMQSLPPERMMRQLSSFCPPLEIRRFFTAGLPLKLVLPLLTQCSSSLEYLDFRANHSDIEDTIRWMEQDLNFPKLRHLFVHASSGVGSYAGDGDWMGFPAAVARIMKASPNLETYSTSCAEDEPGSQELATEILLGVDIRDVKTLQLKNLSFSNVKSELISSIPFSQLQTLKMSCSDPSPWNTNALVGFGRAATSTLRKLDLLDMEFEDLLYLAGSAFPVCPTVQELHLEMFNGWIDFVSRCFPSLQVFGTGPNWSLDVSDADNIHREVSPFLNVKALILLDDYGCRLGPVELFSLFPRLERLNIHEAYLDKYFEKVTRGSEKCFKLLKGLKHLELHGSNPEKCHPSPFLAELKGLQSIWLMTANKTIKLLPLKELPRLKMIRFTWADCLDLGELVEMAERVERVIVTNCCSFPRTANRRSNKALLEVFFNSAPNAECGCKKEGETLNVF